jgi:hypothetical protein
VVALVVEAVHGEADVRAIEAADDHVRIAHPEPLDDLRPDGWGGGRGQREDRRPPERLRRRAQSQVVRAEVVAPLRDAVSLVDDQQRRGGDCQLVEEIGIGELLRSEQEELERILGELGERLLALRGRQARIELRGPEPSVGLGHELVRPGCEPLLAPLLQRLDLVALQRDQGADDDGGAFDEQAGDLVDGRLSGARRHDRERVPAGENGLDRLELARPEVLVAEGLARDAADRVGGGSSG